jgi:hypothetical protein
VQSRSSLRHIFRTCRTCRTCRSSLVLASMLWVLPAMSAAPQPTVTFAEGSNTLLSGGRAFVPSAGVRLRSCDSLHTGPDAMIQVEFDDGSAVLLGPDSRFVFDLPKLSASTQWTQFLQSGWAKITSPEGTNAPPKLIQTAHFDLSIVNGAAVLHVAASGAQVYVERGEAQALDSAAKPQARNAVRTGQTYSRKTGQTVGTLKSGVEPEFAQALPRTLRHTLPMLLPKLKTLDVKPQPASASAQAKADEWLASRPELLACSVETGIRKAQEILTRKGFDVGPVDGLLGSGTRAALRSFQQRSGLPPSGELDAGTLRALDQDGSPGPGPDAQRAAPPNSAADPGQPDPANLPLWPIKKK